jgi:hypothetical protein
MTNRFGGIPVEQVSPEQPKNRFGGVPVEREGEQPSGFVTPRSGFNATQLTDAVTGRKQMTPEIEGLEEVRGAPELNELSGRAFKGSLGLLTESDDQVVKGVLKQQFGDSVSFRQDEKGNEIATLPSGEYVLNKPGLTRQDVLRGIFDAVAFLPSARGPGIIASGVKGMATQGGIEATGESVGGDFDPVNIALSGAINVGGKAVENVAGTVFRGATGSPSNEIVEAGAELGIPVRTSDVLPPQTFQGKIGQQTAEKIPVFGTGAGRESQQAARSEAVDTFAEQFSDFSYSEIVDSLKRNSTRLKRAAGGVMESAGKTLDAASPSQGIPLDNTLNAISNAEAALSKRGVIQSSTAIDDLNKVKEALADGAQNFTSIKENRTALRDLIEGLDKADRSQLPTRAKGLLRGVETAMKRDMDDFARANLDEKQFTQWQKANNIYFQEARKLKNSKIKAVLDRGDITPENVESILFSSKPSEVKILFNGLTPSGKRNARAAIVSRVVTDLSKRANGLTPNSFATEMKKRGLQTGVFFKGQDKKALNGLIKALDATRRAQDAAVTTPTGQQLLGAFGVTGLALEPVTTVSAAGSVGLLARVYETPAVRNALLRLDSLPRGSTRFEKALLEVQTAFVSASQAAQNQ